MLKAKELFTKILQNIKSLNTNNTLTASTVYSGYCHALKRSGVVTVSGTSANGIQISNSYYALTTLPTEYRPPETVYFTGNAMGGSQHVFGYVNANGVVYLYATGVTKYWSYSVTYPVS